MSNFQYPNFQQQQDQVGQTPSSTLGYPSIPGATGYQQGMGYPGTPGTGMPGPGVYPQANADYPQAYPQIPGYQATPGFTAAPGYQPTPGVPTVPQLPFFEQSYIENILRLNKGKIATVYMNFENSQWGSKVFKGVIEAAGKDHIVLSDPVTGMRYILLTIFLNYITFDEEIEYDYPYATLPGQAPLGTDAPIYNVPTPGTQVRKKDGNNTTTKKNSK